MKRANTRWLTLAWIAMATVPAAVIAFLLLTPTGQAIVAAIQVRP